MKDDRALACAQRWDALPDATARETLINEMKEVIMLAQMDGQWKITTTIGGIGGGQKIWKWNPE